MQNITCPNCGENQGKKLTAKQNDVLSCWRCGQDFHSIGMGDLEKYKNEVNEKIKGFEHELNAIKTLDFANFAENRKVRIESIYKNAVDVAFGKNGVKAAYTCANSLSTCSHYTTTTSSTAT